MNDNNDGAQPGPPTPQVARIEGGGVQPDENRAVLRHQLFARGPGPQVARIEGGGFQPDENRAVPLQQLFARRVNIPQQLFAWDVNLQEYSFLPFVVLLMFSVLLWFIFGSCDHFLESCEEPDRTAIRYLEGDRLKYSPCAVLCDNYIIGAYFSAGS